MKTSSKILSIVLLVVILSVGWFFLDQLPSSKTVHLGQEFTLKKNQVAHLSGANVSLKITKFIYEPCKPGEYCLTSGLGVVYTLTVDNREYESGAAGDQLSEAPYSVTLNPEKTDYKTHATFVINKK